MRTRRRGIDPDGAGAVGPVRRRLWRRKVGKAGPAGAGGGRLRRKRRGKGNGAGKKKGAAGGGGPASEVRRRGGRPAHCVGAGAKVGRAGGHGTDWGPAVPGRCRFDGSACLVWRWCGFSDPWDACIRWVRASGRKSTHESCGGCQVRKLGRCRLVCLRRDLLPLVRGGMSDGAARLRLGCGG